MGDYGAHDAPDGIVAEVMMTARPPLEDASARAEAAAATFEAYDPSPEDHDAPLPARMAVKLAAYRRDAAEQELAEAAQAARAQGMSWRALGEAIGTSGEAARQRYTQRI